MGFSRKINIPTRGGRGGNASDSEKLKELHRIIWITLCWLNHSWFHIHGRITAAIRYPPFHQTLPDAKDRWLGPGEIFKILQNYKKYPICSSPGDKPYRPPGGSLFLVDRKKVKHYKRDGHNWRKKNDGTTVMEGNEKLKLRCYYALGEENKFFKRRSYSMLEGDLSHIVLVGCREEEVLNSSEGTSACKNDDLRAMWNLLDNSECTSANMNEEQLLDTVASFYALP